MKILREETAALLIDVQEKLAPAVADTEAVLAATVKLVRGLGVLGVPVIPVRQYPKGLGDYPPALRAALGPHTPSDKVTFSAWDTPEIARRIKATGRKNILAFGMEAHVCVLQTVVDLQSNGFDVVVVADCVASRRERDREMSLRRAEAEGARLATSESILFELLREADTDSFRQILALVK